jgi:hypothetical protein
LTTTGNAGFFAHATNGGYGVVGRSVVIGTYGDTTATAASGAGVQGVSEAFTGQAPGVYGLASSPTAPAVYDRHQNGGNAMRAEVPSNATVNAIAMYALNYSTYTGGGRELAGLRSMASRRRGTDS